MTNEEETPVYGKDYFTTFPTRKPPPTEREQASKFLAALSKRYAELSELAKTAPVQEVREAVYDLDRGFNYWFIREQWDWE